MALDITITDAGRAEIINAGNTGTDPVEITQVAVGTGQYTPDPTQTALQNEVKRLASIAGLVVAEDTLHVTARDESNDEYDVGEFGLFTASGTLFAVYSVASGGPFAQKAAGSSLLLSVDIVLQTLDATSLTFGDISFTNPPASETVAGVARVATQTQTNTGTDNTTIVSPKKLADYFLFKLGQVSTVANTYLRRNAGNNQFEAKTPQSVANELAPLLPIASSTTAGRVELATQVEMNAEADTLRVPPVTVIATYVANKVAALINAAPSALDTLNELAAALGDDPNFATTVTNALAGKSDVGHGHAVSAISGLGNVATRTVGVATASQIPDREAADGRYASISHPHSINQVSGLQTALNAKATPADITTAINNLIASAPGALDTLNELAAALGDDPNFATTVTNALATKASTAYVNARLPAGVIVMWSGSVASIPSGWVLCNGQNNTPDLRNRFIIGAGSSYSPGNTGGASGKTTSNAGAHSHTTSSAGSHNHGGATGGHALTVNEMPSHAHDFVVDINYNNAGTRAASANNTGTIQWASTSSTGGNQPHSHSIGSSGSHTHSTNSTGGHTHNVNVIPPYYALAYIMKT